MPTNAAPIQLTTLCACGLPTCRERLIADRRDRAILAWQTGTAHHITIHLSPASAREMQAALEPIAKGAH